MVSDTMLVHRGGWGYFGAERGELVIVRCPQIQVHPLQGLVDTIRAGLRCGGEGVGSVRGPVLPIVGGVCPSRAANFSSLLLAFFSRWSNRTDGCSGVNGRGFTEGCNGSLFSFVCFMCLFVIRAEVFPLIPRVGFCVDLGFVDRILAIVWLGDVWWVDLAFVSPVVGVFLRVWDRGSLRLSPRWLITYVLSR
ncbi:hypothetical protein TIFTF001_029989 [Ficus carica]|uniref:Transmembrane protein n=1 Tax=Ficus carica TaxID=3494 RepID=A0AA88IYY0_FICCA|nr:hypothetical protein TIFTF001_029989 [Ficus carica]